MSIKAQARLLHLLSHTFFFFLPSSFLLLCSVNWAVAHLTTLSDSSIYTTLHLTSILSSSVTTGVFHTNTRASVELGSPHFESGRETEVFELLVMVDREDEEQR
jgi:hypothetical protein